jgi:hypothetical protein
LSRVDRFSEEALRLREVAGTGWIPLQFFEKRIIRGGGDDAVVSKGFLKVIELSAHRSNVPPQAFSGEAALVLG